MIRHKYRKNRKYVVFIVFCEKRNKGPLDGTYVNLNIVCKNVYMATRDGRPAPHCGEGGVPRPAPPRKNDQNRGEVAGQNNGWTLWAGGALRDVEETG